MKHALSVPKMDEKDIERFWARVDKSGGCWEWRGGFTEKGYGKLYLGGRQVRAHRISYRLAKGDFDPALVVDHICRNHACVNPDHLRAVTEKQNGEHREATSERSNSGYRGVVWRVVEQKWRVQVKHAGRFHWGGYHTELSDAIAAARALRLGLFSHNDLDRV